MSYVKDLVDRGFDGADIHWFSLYFNIELIIESPYTSIKDKLKAINIKYRKKTKMELLAANGSKEDIKKIINAGKIGITYTEKTHNELLTSK